LILALFGLAGFPLAAVTYAFGPADLRFMAIHILLTWSAVVLGFLGGIRWSQESTRDPPRFLRLAGAMLPPLAGGGLLLPAAGGGFVHEHGMSHTHHAHAA
jgi:hypothetical protein